MKEEVSDAMLDIYCGNVDPHLSSETLERAFQSKFGVSARLTGRYTSRGTDSDGPQFCFFNLKSLADYKRAMRIIISEAHPLVIQGRSLLVRLRETSKEKEERRKPSPRKVFHPASSVAIDKQYRIKAGESRGHSAQIPHESYDSESAGVLCLYSSVVLIVSNLPPSVVGPRELFDIFRLHEPIAAFVYADVNLQGVRYGEVQFQNREYASRALAATDGSIVCEHRLW